MINKQKQPVVQEQTVGFLFAKITKCMETDTIWGCVLKFLLGYTECINNEEHTDKSCKVGKKRFKFIGLCIVSGAEGTCDQQREDDESDNSEPEAKMWQRIYRDVMSLRAWSSSSLMALYFSFWAYNSSGGQRSTGGTGRCQGQRRNKQAKSRTSESERWKRRAEGGRRQKIGQPFLKMQ